VKDERRIETKSCFLPRMKAFLDPPTKAASNNETASPYPENPTLHKHQKKHPNNVCHGVFCGWWWLGF
ncbi:hypothetical protein, partial [Escherichia coli]|uniref:hypothetical protein n=1 Tax=Escherichia coli TaxID=562 RepID=UPI003CF82459